VFNILEGPKTNVTAKVKMDLYLYIIVLMAACHGFAVDVLRECIACMGDLRDADEAQGKRCT